MNKIKPIKRLYYQFGDLLTVPHLDAYEIYEILKEAELIEGVAFSAPHGAELPTHYRECFGDRMPYEDIIELIQGVLAEYCERQGYEYHRAPIDYDKGVSR